MKAQSYITSRPSTQYSQQNAWNVNLNNGNVNNNTKTNGNQVRLVSDFSNDRDGRLAPDFLSFSATMIEAYIKCLRTKKSNPNAAYYALRGIISTTDLAWDIWTGNYEIAPGIAFVVMRPVPRECFAATFRDRVVHDWIMIRLEPIMEKIFPDSITANRVGRGTLYAVKMIQQKVYEMTEGYTLDDLHIFSADFQGYFMNIDKRILNDCVQGLISEHYAGRYTDILRWLFAKVNFNQPQMTARKRSPQSTWDKYIIPEKSLYGKDAFHGLAIGNLPSQWDACLYLLLAIEIIMRHGVVADLVTFMDDSKWLIPDKRRFLEKLPEIERELKTELNITLHPRKRNLQHYSKGWAMVGAKGRNGRLYVSDRTVRRMRAKVHYLCSKTHEPVAMHRSINSYFGILQQYCTYKLRKETAKVALKHYGSEMYFANDYRKAVLFKQLNPRLQCLDAVRYMRHINSRRLAA